MSPMAFKSRQRGVALVFAIFIVIVIASTIALLVQWVSLSTQTSSHQILHTRALAAAQSGLDWEIYQLVHSSSCNSTSLILTDGTLAGFTVKLTCQAVGPINEGGINHTWYMLTARAMSGTVGQPDMVSRELETSVWL
ncbi:MAG: hypothetical protein HKM02_08555 [Pseudomonadales bacterium]|nr:hypothetical protein [Pseudomonadales bacterium]